MRDTRRDALGHLTQSLRLAAIVSLAAACAGGPTDIGTPSTQQLPVDSIALAPGQRVSVQGLRLTFLTVSEDSRCPIDVDCVWIGNAAVEIGLALGTGPSHRFVLNTSELRPAAEHGGYRVTLLSLEPAPVSTVRITPEAYRASFRVEAAN